MTRKAEGTGTLVVDLDAIAANYRALREAAAPAECAAVVKADGYGLGAEPIVRRLAGEGCRRFFVATLDEARRLRAAAGRAELYVLDGVLGDEADAFASAGARPVLNSLEQIARWGGRGAALLHIDTGMGRLGLSSAEVERLARDSALLAGVHVELVLTHLACADEPGHALNPLQLERFEALRRRLPTAPTSIGNSAAIFLGPEYRGDVVRPGIALYGGSPFAMDVPNPVLPVVRLEAKILQIRTIDDGQTVGYGATYGAQPPARLAVLGVGYADGYPRCLGNRGVAAVGGVRVPVVGRVSMDLVCIDVSSLPPSAVRVGDWAELIGATISVDEVAAAAGTISYEILTRLGSRLAREYVGADDEEG